MSHNAYDLAAEQGLLGAMLLNGEAIGAFLSVPPSAYYFPKHEALAGLMRDLLAREGAIDSITLLGVVQDAGILNKVGGAPYLHTLMASPWTVSLAPQYAERLLELYGRRRLAEEFQREMQMLDSDWELGELGRPLSASVARIRAVMDELIAFSAAGGVEPPQSLEDFLAERDTYDWLIPGLLERGDRVVVTGEEGFGKALALDTPIPTGKGWTTMGEITVGAQVFRPDGFPVAVLAVTDVLYGRPCYRVTFSDGSSIVADANHQWATETRIARMRTARTDRHYPGISTTREIADTLRECGAANHAVAVCAPVVYPAQELLVDPYVLGIWLGDGSSTKAEFTSADPEVLAAVEHSGYTLTYCYGRGRAVTCGTRGLMRKLRELGVLGAKHIPEVYLRASVDQRLALLQGLMDSDGTIGANGRCEFSVCLEPLARGFRELIAGMGIKSTWRSSPARLDGITIGTRYRVSFDTALPVFRLLRKLKRIRPGNIRTTRRFITSVERIESVPVRCLQVDDPAGMYLVGDQFIPTHNSEFTSMIGVCTAGGVHPFQADLLEPAERRVLIIDCENGRSKHRRRLRRIVGAVDAVRAIYRADPVLWSKSLWVEFRPSGLDLLKPSDEAWLENTIASVGPDMLLLGPLYKLHTTNINDGEAARKMIDTMDRLRERHGFALLTEAHPGHGRDGTGDRMMRPEGSSLFMRWPEFGFGLRRNKDDALRADVISWRGDREEGRNWPKGLVRGHSGLLPWKPDEEYSDVPEEDWGRE